ncbi:MAG: prepilin-type N-terminal cleavage/methylation domain-containing protein [Candidatus Peribacteria bacterium]|nr:prepilin-type N-terminal cleavage/methylation domain-containing protein [Candidatus Peribacteria bacterium]
MKIKTKEQKVKNLSYFAFTLIELMIALLIISSVLIV